MQNSEKQSVTYRLLSRLGIHLSPGTYGRHGFFSLFLKGMRFWKNEVLHKIARSAVILSPAPLSARVVRPLLHRWRGVKLGKNVFIGLEVMFDSVYPERIHIGNGVRLLNRTQIIAHNRDLTGYAPGLAVKDLDYVVKDVFIEDDASIMSNSILLPGVRVGKGAVVAAGSVVTRDVMPYTMVAGVPAREIKRFESKTKTD